MKTIIFPAYNEEKRIGETLKAYCRFFKNRGYEFIVVNDGSSDKTSEVVKHFAKKDKRIKLVEHKTNKGKGESVFTGFKVAKGEIIGFTDADLAYKLEDVAEMIKTLEKSKSLDGVIASKYLGHSFKSIPEPVYKKILSRGLNLTVRLLFGLDYKDTQAGAKVFEREVIDRIKHQPLIGKGFSFDIDLLYKIKQAGFDIKEHPVAINATHKGTKFKISNVFQIFNDIVRIKLYGSKVRQK